MNSNSTVGVVVRVERDALKILDQLGNLRSLRPQEITPRKNAKTAVSLDRARNNIKIGDAITVMDGPNKGKGGKILHLNRNIVFIQSNDILENQGVISTATNNIQLVGATNKMVSPSPPLDPFSSFGRTVNPPSPLFEGLLPKFPYARSKAGCPAFQERFLGVKGGEGENRRFQGIPGHREVGQREHRVGGASLAPQAHLSRQKHDR